jgi:hypothetical protein
MDPFDTVGWQKFTDVCHGEFFHCAFQDRLISECSGLQDVAWAVFYRMLDDSISWLHGSIPALKGAVPAALLSSGRANEVRSCLWRMP